MCKYCNGNEEALVPAMHDGNLFGVYLFQSGDGTSHLTQNIDGFTCTEVNYCPKCGRGLSPSANNEDLDEKENNRIRLLQYDNLRKHFRQLVNDVLGEGYYNEGMDVYGCDKFTCRDLKSAMKKRKHK